MSSGSYNYGGGSNDDFHFYKQWSGANSPSRKQLTENGYSCVLVRMSRQKSSFYDKATGVLNGTGFWYDGLGSTHDTWTSNDELALLGKLSDEIRGHSFNAAVFGAELPQSLDTVLRSTAAVSGALTSLVKGDMAGVGRSLGRLPGQTKKSVRKKIEMGDFSGAWLALRYGWLPLLKDIEEAMKYVESRTRNPRQLVFRSGHTVRSTVNDCPVGPPTYVVQATRIRTIKYKYTLLEQVSTARSLGLLNPAAVLWEKLPFSFVVDWFIPIGNYLDSVSFVGGLSGTWVRSDFRRSVAMLTSRQAAIGASTIVGGDFRKTVVRLDRTKGSSPISVPRPTLKSVEKALSTGHLQNAAALMHQQVLKMGTAVGKIR